MNHELKSLCCNPAPSPACQKRSSSATTRTTTAAPVVAIRKAMRGGSGRALLAWPPRDGKLVNAWAADHTGNVDGAYVDADMNNVSLAAALAKLAAVNGA